VDYDNANNGPWDEFGGGVIGKAAFLRQYMQDYGVDKPVVLNESAFGCPNDDLTLYEWCVNPDPLFYDVQADYLVRSFVRGRPGDLWFLLVHPGRTWLALCGLLGANQIEACLPGLQAAHHPTARRPVPGAGELRKRGRRLRLQTGQPASAGRLGEDR
jgi:hypothetical protein